MICSACDYEDSLVITGTYNIVFPEAAQSLNATGINTKGNHMYRRARRRWCGLLKKHATKVPKATKARRIYFTRYFRKRCRPFDYGNLVGGFKPLLDEIVSADLLVDDAPRWCSEYYRQYPSPDGTDYVIVTIEDYDTKTQP